MHTSLNLSDLTWMSRKNRRRARETYKTLRSKSYGLTAEEARVEILWLISVLSQTRSDLESETVIYVDN